MNRNFSRRRTQSPRRPRDTHPRRSRHQDPPRGRDHMTSESRGPPSCGEVDTVPHHHVLSRSHTFRTPGSPHPTTELTPRSRILTRPSSSEAQGSPPRGEGESGFPSHVVTDPTPPTSSSYRTKIPYFTSSSKRTLPWFTHTT